MLQLTLNLGLTLTGFRTTRPCSLNLLFSDVAVAVAVMVYLNSLVFGKAYATMSSGIMGNAV